MGGTTVTNTESRFHRPPVRPRALPSSAGVDLALRVSAPVHAAETATMCPGRIAASLVKTPGRKKRACRDECQSATPIPADPSLCVAHSERNDSDYRNQHGPALQHRGLDELRDLVGALGHEDALRVVTDGRRRPGERAYGFPRTARTARRGSKNLVVSRSAGVPTFAANGTRWHGGEDPVPEPPHTEPPRASLCRGPAKAVTSAVVSAFIFVCGAKVMNALKNITSHRGTHNGRNGAALLFRRRFCLLRWVSRPARPRDG